MIIALALVIELLQSDADIAVDPVGAVIGCKVQVVADGSHLVLENQQVLGAGTLDAVDVCALGMQPLELVVDRSRADTACDEQDVLLQELVLWKGYQIGGIAERPDHVRKGIAHIQGCHAVSLRTDCLEDNGNKTLFGVFVTDCQRNPLAVL